MWEGRDVYRFAGNLDLPLTRFFGFLIDTVDPVVSSQVLLEQLNSDTLFAQSSSYLGDLIPHCCWSSWYLVSWYYTTMSDLWSCGIQKWSELLGLLHSTDSVDSIAAIQHIFGSLIPCLCIYDIISPLHTCPVISQDLSFETCFWASHIFLVTFLCKTWTKVNRLLGNNWTWHLHPFMHNMHS